MAMIIWQSKRSVTPPWPGIVSPKSFILKARLKPLAKKPPVSGFFVVCVHVCVRERAGCLLTVATRPASHTARTARARLAQPATHQTAPQTTQTPP
jgi:hypothetical protein